MEWMLIVVSLVSLGIATAMSVVAWKLGRDSRQRSSARVDALETLALGSDDDDAGGLVPALAMAAPVSVRPAAAPVPASRPVAVRFSSLEDDDHAAATNDGGFEPGNGDSDEMFGAATEHAAPPARWYALVGVATMMAV